MAPIYVGEMVVDTTTGNVWCGIIKGDQTATGWKLLS
jgi:hypothetical protein